MLRGSCVCSRAPRIHSALRISFSTRPNLIGCLLLRLSHSHALSRAQCSHFSYLLPMLGTHSFRHWSQFQENIQRNCTKNRAELCRPTGLWVLKNSSYMRVYMVFRACVHSFWMNTSFYLDFLLFGLYFVCMGFGQVQTGFGQVIAKSTCPKGKWVFLISSNTDIYIPD